MDVFNTRIGTFPGGIRDAQVIATKQIDARLAAVEQKYRSLSVEYANLPLAQKRTLSYEEGIDLVCAAAIFEHPLMHPFTGNSSLATGVVRGEDHCPFSTAWYQPIVEMRKNRNPQTQQSIRDAMEQMTKIEFYLMHATLLLSVIKSFSPEDHRPDFLIEWNRRIAKFKHDQAGKKNPFGFPSPSAQNFLRPVPAPGLWSKFANWMWSKPLPDPMPVEEPFTWFEINLAWPAWTSASRLLPDKTSAADLKDWDPLTEPHPKFRTGLEEYFAQHRFGQHLPPKSTLYPKPYRETNPFFAGGPFGPSLDGEDESSPRTGSFGGFFFHAKSKIVSPRQPPKFATRRPGWEFPKRQQEPPNEYKQDMPKFKSTPHPKASSSRKGKSIPAFSTPATAVAAAESPMSAPPPTPLLTPQQAFTAYDSVWKGLKPYDAHFPYPTKTLSKTDLKSRQSIPHNQTQVARWSEAQIMSLNTMLFLANGNGVSAGVAVDMKGRPHIQFAANVAKPALNALFKHVKLKEWPRWHSDKLKRRNGSSDLEAPVDEEMANSDEVRAIQVGLDELMEACKVAG